MRKLILTLLLAVIAMAAFSGTALAETGSTTPAGNVKKTRTFKFNVLNNSEDSSPANDLHIQFNDQDNIPVTIKKATVIRPTGWTTSINDNFVTCTTTTGPPILTGGTVRMEVTTDRDVSELKYTYKWTRDGNYMVLGEEDGLGAVAGVYVEATVHRRCNLSLSTDELRFGAINPGEPQTGSISGEIESNADTQLYVSAISLDSTTVQDLRSISSLDIFSAEGTVSVPHGKLADNKPVDVGGSPLGLHGFQINLNLLADYYTRGGVYGMRLFVNAIQSM